jgi:pseudaminic acid cytidylyltransferase
MRLLGLIAGRGGSKRLPRKNVLPFRGRPMIEWTVQAANKAALFARIVVSTDDDEIAAAGAAAGAEVLRRPSELGGDEVRLTTVTQHAIEQLSGFDAFCLMLPNCPLRTAADLRASYQVFTASSGVATIMSVFSYNWSPPTWALRSQGSYLRMVDPAEAIIGPREGLWCPSGAIIWKTTTSFSFEPTFYPRALVGAAMPWQRAIDIDTRADYEAALCIAFALDHGFAFSDEPCVACQ